MGTPKGTVPWNAGTGKGWTDKRGYRWLRVLENGKRRARREHRVIMERGLGRRLDPWELVHHKDEDPGNNAPDNLEIRTFGDHTAEHHNGSRHSYDSKRTMEAFGLMREELKHLREINADMLKALRRARENLISAIRAGVELPDFDPASHVTIQQIDSAIAKAEGQP